MAIGHDPPLVSPADLELVIAAFDTATVEGIRNRAMLLLAAHAATFVIAPPTRMSAARLGSHAPRQRLSWLRSSGEQSVRDRFTLDVA